MTSEDEFVFSEDDEPAEPGDGLAGRLLVLRDVMSSYDLSFMMDVRDPIYMSKLDEAVGALGLHLELSAEPARDIGGGLYESRSRMTAEYRMESAEYSYRAVSVDPALTMLLAVRGVLSMASLLNPPKDVDVGGGLGLSIS